MERADVEMVGPENLSEINGRAVKPCESGEGLPYAPINWPNPGDNWGWRVGKRVAALGYYSDRYLFPPNRFDSLTAEVRKTPLASKLAVQRFIQKNFPGADAQAFFNLFTWRIPANSSFSGAAEDSNKTSEDSVPRSASIGVSCKIGNKTCPSLLIQEGDDNPKPMPCDICCTEPHFCVYCCCILCCKKIKTDYEGYSYLKCEAPAEGGYICGHVAHLNCGLRSYMAGTDDCRLLDAEYYCRRCDSKKDLISHVLKLLETCQSIKSREDIERILNVGVFILRGSKKTVAKRLLIRLKFSIIKLKCGTPLDDIWFEEEAEMAKFMEGVDDTSEATKPAKGKYPPIAESNLLPDLTQPADYRNTFQRIDDECNQFLQNLKWVQEKAYKIAEVTLIGSKNNLKNLLEQHEGAEYPDANTAKLLKDAFEQARRDIKAVSEFGNI